MPNSQMNSNLESDTQTVKDLCNIEKGMSAWETEFVESISRQVLDEKKELTPKQRQKVKEIFERIDNPDPDGDDFGDDD